MSAPSHTAAQTLRISAADAKRRLESGEPATILDMRNSQAWASSPQKITGAVRVDPAHFQIDPSWPKDRFTLVY
jgi:hypothetical protein